MPVFDHTLTAPIVLTARPGMRLTPNVGLVECERRSNGLIHTPGRCMPTPDANRIEGIEPEADNEFRANDSDLGERKFFGRPDEIIHRYRTAHAALLYEREKISGVNTV